MENYKFIFDKAGNYIQGENFVTMMNTVTSKVVNMKITPDILNIMKKSKKIINMRLINIGSKIDSLETETSNSTLESARPKTAENLLEPNNTKEKTVKWARDAILCLIATYAEKYNLIQNSTHRNTQVWDLISEDLKKNNFVYSPKQCKWKFSYLKDKYTKVKDARKAGNSGGCPVHFDYINEMEDIFEKSVAVNGLPFPAASSSYTPLTSTAEIDVNGNDEEDLFLTEPRPKVQRLTISETVHRAINKLSEERKKYQIEKLEETRKQIDLQERQLALQEKLLKDHKELMLKLIEKL